MSKNRSTTNRNLLGGFFGGVLGILLSALLTPSFLWLAIGCFTGVCGGYWYGELWSILTSTLSRAKKIAARIKGGNRQIKSSRAHWRTILWYNYKDRNFQRSFAAFRTMGLKKWVRANPIAAIRLLTWVGAILVILAVLTYGYFTVAKAWSSAKLSNAGSIRWYANLAITGLMVTMTIFQLYFPTSFTPWKTRFERSRLYLRKHGIIKFFLLKTLGIFIESVLLVLFSLSFFGLGTAALFVGWIWFGLVYSLLKMLWFVFTKTNHMLCFVVTIITTGTTAYLFEPSVYEPVRLWLLALATGAVAGLLTEGSRRLYLWCTKKIPFLAHAAKQSTREYESALEDNVQKGIDFATTRIEGICTLMLG
jgi:hypothetical protein